MRDWGLHPSAAWARNQPLLSRGHLSVGLQGCIYLLWGDTSHVNPEWFQNSLAKNSSASFKLPSGHSLVSVARDGTQGRLQGCQTRTYQLSEPHPFVIWLPANLKNCTCQKLHNDTGCSFVAFMDFG